jgi:hypothetical protein
VDPLYASGGFYTGPTPAHTANAHFVNPESSRNHLYTPSQVSPQDHAHTPPHRPPVVFPTSRVHPDLPNHAPTPTPAVETRTRPTNVGLTSHALHRTPTNQGTSTQAVVFHRAPHTYPQQRVSQVVPVTGGIPQTRHPYVFTPTPAANVRGTPTSVDLFSPALPRTPTNPGHSTQAVVLHRAPHTNPPQHVSVPRTGNSHQTRYSFASTPTPATNTRGTPTSVQSASLSLPRTPANPGFLPAQALAHHGALQNTPSSSRVFYHPTSNPAPSDAYVRGPMPGQLLATQPHPSTQRVLSQTTPTKPTGYASQTAPTSASTTESSPPQNASISRLRESARENRALSNTLHASGDNKGAADAITKAIFEETHATRLEIQIASHAKRRAKTSAKLGDEIVRRRATQAESYAANKLSNQDVPGQPDASVRLDVLGQPLPSTRNQHTTPTHPPTSTRWVWNQNTLTRLNNDAAQPTPTSASSKASSLPQIWNQTTPARLNNDAAQPTATSASSKASSPPQSATVQRLRRVAGRYRAIAHGMQRSGDYQGAANAIDEAIFREKKAHRLHSKNSNQIKNRAERAAKKKAEKQAAKQAAEPEHAARPKPATPESITSYSQDNENLARAGSTGIFVRGDTGPLQTSGDDSIAAMNAKAEARLEARQAASLQTSGYGFTAINARRDSYFAEEEVDKHAETNASKPADDSPEQRTPSPQDQPTTSKSADNVPERRTPSPQNRPEEASRLQVDSASPDRPRGGDNSSEQTRPTRPAAKPTPASANSEASSSPPRSATALRFLTKSNQLREVAGVLRLQGDAAGSADAMAKAKAEDKEYRRRQYNYE